ncbi:hypothetical protein I5J06_00470 [Pseudomonas aeruginosa]|nr:hypothetical protein [Pseudomonas aeruginosa]
MSLPTGCPYPNHRKTPDRQENRMSDFKNWIEDVDIGKCGNGYFVRIDGCDIFESINQYGCKARRSLSIAERLGSKEEAKASAIEWLEKQLAKVKATA